MRQHGEKMDQLRKELVTKDKFQTGLKQSGEEFSRLRWELLNLALKDKKLALAK